VALPEPPSFDAVDPSQPESVRNLPPLSGDARSWLKEDQPNKYERKLQQYERTLWKGENSASPPDDARSLLREAYESKLENLQTVDDLVAELLTALKETGQLERTYIFFMTDNGYLLGEHRLVGKGLPYEESISTPLIVRGPGVKARTFTGTAQRQPFRTSQTLPGHQEDRLSPRKPRTREFCDEL